MDIFTTFRGTKVGATVVYVVVGLDVLFTCYPLTLRVQYDSDGPARGVVRIVLR